jgi:SAM-dependent methyltransferase
LLEIGAGRGDLAAMLVTSGWRVTAVEPSTAACRHLEARGIDARCGTLGEVELEREAYGAALFNHSLEHVPDPLDSLRRVREALRSGGPLLITVPNFGGWQRRAFGSRWFHLDVPRHRMHFSPDAMRRLLDRAGFRLLELVTSSSAIGLAGSLQYAFFGRCLFPDGLGLRIASGAAASLWPASVLADRVAGSGDLIHVVAQRND